MLTKTVWELQQLPQGHLVSGGGARDVMKLARLYLSVLILLCRVALREVQNISLCVSCGAYNTRVLVQARVTYYRLCYSVFLLCPQAGIRIPSYEHYSTEQGAYTPFPPPPASEAGS